VTYLQIVNEVLKRMREDTVTTTVANDDIVADMVTSLVNDAKRAVEDAHTWNALRYEWDISTIVDTPLYSLTSAGNYAKIEYILTTYGQGLTEVPLQKIRMLKAQPNTVTQQPTYYAVNGLDASGDVRIEVFPKPDAVYPLNVYGFKRQPDLSADDDVLLVPSKPVVYLALALAARERGEVGGQTAAELFGMAKNYLSDAIAWDASLNDLDNIWMTV
jgi:hypothetical protein